MSMTSQLVVTVKRGVDFVDPIIYTKNFYSDREFNQGKVNDVDNDIFITQRCNQFPVGKNRFLLMNKIEYNE